MTYNQAPITELRDSLLEEASIRLLIKCEYLNHPLVSGNKWWKLKYNLVEAARLGKKRLLTFGGAYSNHIYATAATANELGFELVGIIRGEETLPLNSTLAFAKGKGMQLHYVTREDYRKKTEPDFQKKLTDLFGDFYLIPEGGTNELAVKGVAEFANSLLRELKFDYLSLPVGTGGTIAGIISGLDAEKKIIGFPALKGAQFLEREIRTYTDKENWQLMYDYHFGGYAKSTKELTDFMEQFERAHNIPLDPIYTAKMMFGIFDLVKQGFFKRGSTLLIVHTGGLQDRL
ncbi:MAG: 1-aminocyclopropane-1-carboxylate deaminase/D-cysteine desulfhydrase [Flammeovirgaceae bacterium]|nr:1-aminocyclopropane-1-carboxylate deaminase/D-cysteine desulfhydrase [Flammeovirgaceae bacterium]